MVLSTTFLYLSPHAKSEIYDSAKPDLSYKAYKSMVEKDNVIYYCIGDY
jgi:hypothetical protein